MDTYKDGKLGYRIVAFKLVDGSIVIGQTSMADDTGHELERGYWAASTANAKVLESCKKYNFKKFNHGKHFSMIVG